jgi:hypothetical protein
MTKVQIRFRLTSRLDDDMMANIATAHSVYGIMRIAVTPSMQEILVDYDASRLRTEDVGATLKRRGIDVDLEK